MAKSSKSSTKKASAPKTKKKAANTAAPKTEAAAPARPIRREVGGVGLLVLAALSVVGLFNYGGAVTAGFTDILKGLIGYGYYILPVALLLGGLTLLRHRGRPVRFRVFSPDLFSQRFGQFRTSGTDPHAFPQGSVPPERRSGRRYAVPAFV